MLMVMALPIMVACGGDDESEQGNSGSTTEGVNVTSGKKLVELKWYFEDFDVPAHIKIEYDSKGRLSKVKSAKINYEIVDGTVSSSYTGEYTNLATIDYDLRMVKMESLGSCSFSLNKDGYINQIGKYSLNYDSKGYLVGVDELKEISSLVYENNDFIKASISSISGGNLKMYFITYGKTETNGDLFVTVTRSSEDKGMNNNSTRQALCFIAYQAGLFGKVTKCMLNLKDKNESTANFLLNNNSETTTYKFEFVWK